MDIVNVSGSGIVGGSLRQTWQPTTLAMAHPSPNTSLLLQRWHGGQSEALGQLLEAHLSFVQRKVRERMSPVLHARHESGDFVQEAMLEFLEHAPRFEIENGRLFRGLLYMIVKNTMLEEERWWRAKRRDIARERPMPEGSVLNLEAGGSSPDSMAAQAEEIGFIRIGLEFLSSSDRRVVVLRDFEKLSDQQLGEALGKSSDAARMQYNRAVLKLTRIVTQIRHGGLGSLLDSECEDENGPGRENGQATG